LTLAGVLAGCGPSYSPDTYASNAVQQANKVERGQIVGVREVAVSASGTVGAVSGGAAGGIAGAQVGNGPISALTALGGSLVGGVAGVAAEHVADDTTAFEYIVRKPNGDLVSVTQRDKTPLALGQKVLVIAGNQARIVPDYTVAADPPAVAKPADAVKAEPSSAAAPTQPAPPAASAATPAQSAGPATAVTPAPSGGTVLPGGEPKVDPKAAGNGEVAAAPPPAADEGARTPK
jgi:outer membrane lipoprotein SlyB